MTRQTVQLDGSRRLVTWDLNHDQAAGKQCAFCEDFPVVMALWRVGEVVGSGQPVMVCMEHQRDV